MATRLGGEKSNYSCLKMLFWYLNFMNHPVWPNNIVEQNGSLSSIHGIF